MSDSEIVLSVTQDEVQELLGTDSQSLLYCNEEMEDTDSDEVLPDEVEAYAYYSQKFYDEVFAHHYENLLTDIDIVGEHLAQMYPDEDFDSEQYQRILLPKYLSARVTKKQFFLMENQWGTEICHFPENGPIRMRMGVTGRYNRTKETHFVHHVSCINDDHPGFQLASFTYALLTVEARDCHELISMMVASPNLFFCNFCSKFMFNEVEYQPNSVFKIPSSLEWPPCEFLVNGLVAENSNDKTYTTLHYNILWAEEHDEDIKENIPPVPLQDE